MNKTALITGATEGIGYELARIHAEKGGDLILVARNKEKLDEIKNDLERTFGVTVNTIQKDLSLHGSAYEVYNKVNDLNLSVDYLMNNAGFGDVKLFSETDWPKQERMINLNVTTLTHFTRLFLPQMITRGSGKIMNVASVASFVPGPTMSVYFASKAYVLSFSEAVAEELRGKGITVTALCPGPTESNFHLVAHDGKKTKERKMPSSRDVALYGYRSMMNGRVVAVPGFDNKLLVSLIWFLPNWAIVRIVRKIQERRHR
ncbi:MAG: short-chain dehydrogenase [Bacteroidetes bacterium GWE2_41_25]|nr:MAG: short-chain dehydrogenase [Bacteroidetes bacterium GWE2_41_25]